MQQRLQKALASAGIASRRSCEALIVAGKVTVNGVKVTELGAKADPDVDDIRVNNQRIHSNQILVYIALNKPTGYVTTVADKHAKQTVMDLVQGINVRVYPVGRLDADSAGILILTNDGDFTEKMTHPRHQVPKTYRVIVRGLVPEFVAADLSKGLMLEDGLTSPAEVEWVDYDEKNNVSIIDITIREGRNRQVRRMFDAVGYPVLALTRMSIGPITTIGLAPGTWRKLLPKEVDSLLAESGDSAKPVPSTRSVDAHPLDERPISQALLTLKAKSKLLTDEDVVTKKTSAPRLPTASKKQIVAAPVAASSTKVTRSTIRPAKAAPTARESLRQEAAELARKLASIRDDDDPTAGPRKFTPVTRTRKPK